ncbi:MAG: patatin family protein [Oscillospiraceae bacterium]|nr:patatin family protein [Oscillospiraceae bacterium]
MKTGLILEGGAMRGMFTCGVMDVFMEQGIAFDGAAGISAGAVFGCNYKSGQIGRAIRYNKAYCRNPQYCSLRSLIRTGDLFGADFCYRQLPDRLDPFDRESFRKNPMEFHIGATDIRIGETVFHRCTDGGTQDTEWMRASASMPLVSRVVKIDGRELLDGGIADPVPYAYMEELGFRHNVIVLTQPAGYRKEKSSILPVIRIGLRRYPQLVKAMETRHVLYNRQMEELDGKEKSGTAIVIRPPEALGIGRTEHNPQELERVYQIGRAEALHRLNDVMKYMDDADK